MFRPTEEGQQRAGKLFENLVTFCISSQGVVSNSREESNAITAYAFKNSFLDQLREEGKVTDEEMKKLLIEVSARLEAWLIMRDVLADVFPALYNLIAGSIRKSHTGHWEEQADGYDMGTQQATISEPDLGFPLDAAIVEQLLARIDPTTNEPFRATLQRIENLLKARQR